MAHIELGASGPARTIDIANDEALLQTLQEIFEGFRERGGCVVHSVGERGAESVVWLPVGTPLTACFDGKVPDGFVDGLEKKLDPR